MNLLKNAPGAREASIMGIRPEHLDIGNTGWELKVETVELLGAERLVYCRLGDETLIVRTDEQHPAPKPDSTIHVAPRADRVHWFDAATGKRL
jgi:sn-glycerol 3-phosphate transport system ATP-binding protein